MTATEHAVSILAAYQTGLIALSILCLSVLIQSFLVAPLAFLKEEQTPGMPLKGDHQLFSFRVARAYDNSTENLPAFGFVLLAAILSGANPSLVNWLAVIHLLFRLAYWAAYYSGIGKAAGGPRTICYVGGLVSNIVLAITAIYAAISA